MLGFKPKSEYREPNEEPPGKFSRRKALGMLTGAGALIASGPLRAETSETPAGNWESERRTGFETLREAARDRDKEEVSFFIKNGAEGHWLHFGATGGDTFSSIPLPDIEKALGDAETTLEVAHTHPSRTILRERGLVNVPASASEAYPMPPSFQDVLGMIEIKHFLKGNGSRVSGDVVDQTGTWHYDIDPQNPFVREIDATVTRMEGFSEALSPESRQEIAAFSAKNGMDEGDPRFLGISVFQHLSEFSPELQKSLRELVNPFLSLMSAPTMVRLVQAAESDFAFKDLNQASERENTIEAYRRGGVLLSYSPFAN